MTVHYEYNSARAEANVTKYDFDSTAEYVCFNGMKFEDDFDKTNVSATCQTGHDWLEPTSWGQCVDSKWIEYFYLHPFSHHFSSKAKTCTGLPAVPTDGNASALYTGSRYGPICSNMTQTITDCPFIEMISYNHSFAGHSVFNFNVSSSEALSGIYTLFLQIELSGEPDSVQVKLTTLACIAEGPDHF